MNVIFWGIIALLTIAAWSCVIWPFCRKSASPVGYGVKIGLAGFPVIALGLYLGFGDSRQLQQVWTAQRQNAEIARQAAKIKNPQELVTQLRDHLRQDPRSGEGWYLLGKLYLDLRQYAEAESALTQARRLQPQSGETMLALAKANFFRHQGHLTPAMEAALSGMLESLTEPVDALNLLAVNAYQRKDFHLAVNYWQRALSLVQPDSPDSRTLLGMISDAQHQEKGVDNGRNN